MRAMLLDAPARRCERPRSTVPEPGPGQVRVRVHACGVCRTDLHLRDGEVEAGPPAADPRPPDRRRRPTTAARVGVPWLGWTDGECAYCRSGRENLCVSGALHGPRHRRRLRRVRGRRRALRASPLPEAMSDLEVAPLLCGGLIGYRALRLAGDGERLGLYGFGSSAHIICQVAVHQGRRVFAFTRAEDEAAQALARCARRRVGRRRDARPARSRSTPRSSSPRPARSSPPRCARPRPAASWCAPAST